MHNAFPVTDVLFAQRSIKPIKVTRGGDIGRRSTFAKHLLDGISGYKVDQQENKANHQPDYWDGIENALDKWPQVLVLLESA